MDVLWMCKINLTEMSDESYGSCRWVLTSLPTSTTWEAPVLPLNYTRRMAVGREFTTDGGRKSPPDGKGMVLVGVEVRMMVDGVCLLRKTGRATLNGHAVFPEAIP